MPPFFLHISEQTEVLDVYKRSSLYIFAHGLLVGIYLGVGTKCKYVKVFCGLLWFYLIGQIEHIVYYPHVANP